jgi:hypothetical protein
MCKRRIIGILTALMTTLSVMAPAFAQYYVRPHYNHHSYRGYAPYAPYRYYHPDHTVRNVAIGAGVGAVVGGLIGALATHHGYRYD